MPAIRAKEKMHMERDLLYRYFNGDTTSDEEQRIMDWAEASPQNYREYLEERRLWCALMLHAERQPAQRPALLRRLTAWRVNGAAACILLLIGVMGIFFAARPLLDERMQQVVVPAGQRVELQLSDGTKVWLNSKSRLEYPASFGWGSRKVSLSGEGYFEVTHDARKPFVVQTEGYDVRVLGTTFNVYAYDNDRTFETALLEGSVEISSRTDASQRIVLQPNEAAVMAADGRLTRTRLTDMGRFRWTEGLICLNDVPFGELLERFSDYFDIRILLKNPKLYDVRCTGKFRQSDGIDYSLHVLQRFVNFRYTHDEERHTIEIR